MGPNTAFKYIKEFGSLEKVMAEMTSGSLKSKHALPADYPWQDARELFVHPDVRQASDPECDFKWEDPDVDGLVAFLVGEKGFNEDRVRAGAARLSKSQKSSQQSRLEGFFKPKEKTEEEKASLKRKNEAKVEEMKKKKKTQAKEKKEAKAKPRGTA